MNIIEIKYPPKLREYFKKEKDNAYIKNINPNQPIKEQNLKEETLALIAMLNLQYWCENEGQKVRLKMIYAQNEDEYQNKLREIYKTDNLFKNKQKSIENQQMAMIKYEKDTFFKKIKKFIMNFFKLR